MEIEFSFKNAPTSLFPAMFDCINKKMTLMTCNAQTVRILIDPISMYFSFNMYHYKQLYMYKQSNLTCRCSTVSSVA